MSKKKTPKEKKEAAYERDHYTFAWHSPHSFPKSWKKKKNYANRQVRRKSKSLLHIIENSPYENLGPEEESLTSEFFRKGLSRRKLLKTGVVNLRKKTKLKRERRERGFDLKRRSHAARMDVFRKLVNAIVCDKEYTEKNLFELSRLANMSSFQAFLDEEPKWIPKLQQWMLSAQTRIAWRQSRARRQKLW